MSGALENRAAVFTSQPQAVEVYQAGAWWPGELLGWRHDDSGTCQVWVRVVLGGVEETAWTELNTLRLPERHLSVAPSAVPTGPSATPEMPVRRSSARLRDVSANADPSATVSLPMVRERSSNHPAGGRRRAPDTGQAPAVQAPLAPVAVPPRGRHRAPADPGRHRAADTGLFAVVSNDAPSSDARSSDVPSNDAPSNEVSPSQARAADVDTTGAAPSGHADEALTLPPRIGWTVPAGVEPDLLTRPMRLSDHAPHSRRPRVNGVRPV